MKSLTIKQRITLACEDVDFGFSIELAACKWDVPKQLVIDRIEYDHSDEGLEEQQLKYDL